MPDSSLSPGARLRAAVETEQPLQVVGAINAYCAMLAERAGFRAIYLSGAGVANASFGLPDLGITTLNELCEDVRRISAACPPPPPGDAPTALRNAFHIPTAPIELSRPRAPGAQHPDPASPH